MGEEAKVTAGGSQAVHNEEKSASGRWKMGAYEAGSNFDHYLALLNNFFALNNETNDERKVRIVMNQIGDSAAIKIMKASAPKIFSDFTFDELIKLCKSLFSAQRNTIVEHFRFNQRQQKQGESLTDYAIELQAMAGHCDFGVFYDTALRDRFVAGLLNNETKKVLLQMNSDTKFAAMVEAAKREELVQAASNRMQIAGSSGSVNKVSFGNSGAKGKMRGRSKSRGRGQFSHNFQQNPTHAKGSSDRKHAVRCHRCHMLGHYARDCQAAHPARGQNRPNVNAVNEESFEEQVGNIEVDTDDWQTKSSVALGEHNEENGVHVLKFRVNGAKISFEVDTGTKFTVICESDYEKHFPNLKLHDCNLPLRVVSGEKLQVRGKILINLKIRGAPKLLEIVVLKTKSNFMPLLGREWLNVLCPSWRKALTVNAIATQGNCDDENFMAQFREKMCRELKENFGEVFDGDMSKPIRGIVVDIRMKDNVSGFVHKAYTVPHSLKVQVEAEIDKSEKSGVIKRVEYVAWASPMVTVKKPNGDIRCCLDGSKTINRYIETNHYPIPIIDDLLANKSEANWFSVLDLKGAYTQLCVSEKSQQILGLNTIKGLYVYQRLPFGIKPAASIFQSAMDKILCGLKNVQAYIDDVLIWGKTPEELYATMKLVFERLKHYNVKVNHEKCLFMVREVKYLGHILSREGIKPNAEKLKAVLKAPVPENVTQLRSFIGMVTFYSKFLKSLNGLLLPLYNLLKKEVKFEWSNECQRAFDLCKKELCGDHLLEHYDAGKPIVITCDASDDGISGILSHRINGEEKPVFFVSRKLTVTEKKYPILHREALAIVFAVEKFYKYVYGHFIEIFTDHKPLIGVFGLKKGEPPVVATRLQGYIMRLSIYDYEVKYRKGKENGNADMLSRLPIDESPSSEDKIEEKVCLIKSNFADAKLKLNIDLIREQTNKDEKLRKLKFHILNGWSDNVSRDLRHYYDKNEVLGIDCGCLMMEDRLIIPEKLKFAVLRLLHTNHLGISRMKMIARKYVYWEGINGDVEKTVQMCEICQKFRKDDQKKVVGSWPEPRYPFERVHIDFFSFGGKEFLIFVDAFSRWLEIKRMSKTNAQAVLKELEKIFKTFGFAKELVSDNGPPFFSLEFNSSLESWGIKVTKSPPYHPQSNGIVERAVQTAKSFLRKITEKNLNDSQVTEALENFLFDYRNQPHTQENFTPSQRIFKFTPRTELTTLKLDREKHVNLSQNYVEKSLKRGNELENCQKYKIESKNKVKEFKIGEKVLYISRAPGHVEGVKAVIVKKNSELTYYVNVEGNVRLAHINQLRKSIIKDQIFNFPSMSESQNVENLNLSKNQPEASRKLNNAQQTTENDLQRPRRLRNPVKRLNYSKF